MNDTSPEIAAMVHARLMAKTGEERFLMGIRMHEAARRMVMASFPPGISDEQLKKLLFERFYGDQGSKASACSTEIKLRLINLATGAPSIAASPNAR
jgi:hypothetical protein